MACNFSVPRRITCSHVAYAIMLRGIAWFSRGCIAYSCRCGHRLPCWPSKLNLQRLAGRDATVPSAVPSAAPLALKMCTCMHGPLGSSETALLCCAGEMHCLHQV